MTQGDRRLKCHDHTDKKTQQCDNRQRVDPDLFGDKQRVMPANSARMARRLDQRKAELTDESLLEKLKNGQNEVARGVFIAGVIAHVNEHYGNLVTYMRLKGIVPPSTERAQKAAAAAKKPSQN